MNKISSRVDFYFQFIFSFYCFQMFLELHLSTIAQRYLASISYRQYTGPVCLQKESLSFGLAEWVSVDMLWIRSTSSFSTYSSRSPDVALGSTLSIHK